MPNIFQEEVQTPLDEVLTTLLKHTPNATLWTMCNTSFGFQTIHTKLSICVYNHICNNMASANKVNFQK